jgi:peptide/nickel transport system substrate-binding protein
MMMVWRAKSGWLAAGAAAILLSGSALRAQEGPAPQYGGNLEIGTIFYTISALSFDSYDWNWKHNHDTGAVYEQLFAADLSQARHLGGKFEFVADAWIPTEALRGELAEKWEWKQNPLQLVITLRQGVMFPEKPGVMKARELVADDVVYAFNRLSTSPKRTVGYFDYVSSVEAKDKYTVVFNMKEYNAEWAYRFGYGYYSGIIPHEVVEAAPDNAGAKDWKNINGTGPFMLSDYVAGNSNTYVKNPNYWDKLKIGGTEYKLPFVDKVTYRIIKDESTVVTAFRTGKLDMLEAVRWQNVDSLKKTNPEIQWHKYLSFGGTYLAMRVDTKPFDDVRVRRALNMAVNKQEIVDSYYNGNAQLFAFPEHPDYVGYYEPLESMPDSVKELFTYNPEKAKKLLAEAGYPDGFTFKVQVCSCSPNHMDLLPLVAGYLEQVGVKMDIQPMEYGAYLSAMTTQTNAPGYFQAQGHTNPTTSIRKQFLPGQVWNPSQWNDPVFTKKMEGVYREPDEDKRKATIRDLTREIVDKAPYIWLPTAYNFAGWWPWVKNYGGEEFAGSARPGPVYARIWVDQDMKKRMGY